MLIFHDHSHFFVMIAYKNSKIVVEPLAILLPLRYPRPPNWTLINPNFSLNLPQLYWSDLFRTHPLNLAPVNINIG